MRIEGVDKNTIIKLRNSSISTQMKSLESCDWVVLEEEENVVKGAAGMGGMFHVSGIQIHEKFRGKGLLSIMLKKTIEIFEGYIITDNTPVPKVRNLLTKLGFLTNRLIFSVKL